MDARLTLHTQLGRAFRLLPHVRGAVTAGSAITRKLIGSRRVQPTGVRMRDGTRMILDVRARTELEPFWAGDYERPATNFLKSCLPTGGVALDVGANIGLISVALGKHLQLGGAGRVFAFEPVPANFNRLQENIRLNRMQGVVTAHNLALGEVAGQISISTVEHAAGAETGNAVLTSALLETEDHGNISAVQMARLDDLAGPMGIERVDIVKVDIEGAEVMFLRGAREFLARHRPILFGEFNACFIERFGHSVVDAYEIFRPWNYRIFHFEHGKLMPVTKVKHGMEDLVFVPNGLSAARLRHARIPTEN